mgnify:CR=1 FL=1
MAASSSLGSFALRLISSDVGDAPSGSQSREEVDMFAHVMGVFINMDTDKDGMITRHQLIQALHLLGLRPTEVLLRKFVSNTDDNKPQQQQQSKRRSSVLMSADERNRQSKISSSIFCTIVMEEWRRVKIPMRGELDHLFAFATDSDNDKAYEEKGGDDVEISRDALKHLLQQVQVPSALNDKDFEAFIKLLPFRENGTTTIAAVKSALYDGAAQN